MEGVCHPKLHCYLGPLILVIGRVVILRVRPRAGPLISTGCHHRQPRSAGFLRSWYFAVAPRKYSTPRHFPCLVARTRTGIRQCSSPFAKTWVSHGTFALSWCSGATCFHPLHNELARSTPNSNKCLNETCPKIAPEKKSKKAGGRMDGSGREFIFRISLAVLLTDCFRQRSK